MGKESEPINLLSAHPENSMVAAWSPFPRFTFCLFTFSRSVEREGRNVSALLRFDESLFLVRAIFNIYG